MTWTLILALGAVAWGFKALGALVVGGRTMPDVVQRCLLLIPAALLAGLITKDTFTSGTQIVLDARAAGLAAAVLASWRRLPFAVVIVSGVGTTALLRALV
ncbi:MAG: hypothetical protein RL330_422 [Actinomycetota bacterium]